MLIPYMPSAVLPTGVLFEAPLLGPSLLLLLLALLAALVVSNRAPRGRYRRRAAQRSRSGLRLRQSC